MARMRSRRSGCPVPRLAAGTEISRVNGMSTVSEIEAALEKLSPMEQRQLAAWYEERQALLNAADSLFQTYDTEEKAR